MRNKILEPLKFYEQTGKIEHDKNAREYFDSLVLASKINVEENRKSAADYRKQLHKAECVNKKIKKLRVLKGFLIFLIVAGLLTAILGGILASGTLQIILPCVGAIVAVTSLLIILLKIRKTLRKALILYEQEMKKANALLAVAEGQMAALNALFTERDTFNVIEKTLPDIIKFSPDYSMELDDDFRKNYDFIDNIYENRSVIDTVSGRLLKNPFVFYRYVNHRMGSKNYHGTLVISYYVTVRDSKGNLRRERRTQTLHATVNKPFPYYSYHTALGYGHQCSPDLNFSRTATDVEELSDRQVERRVKKGEKKLRKLSEKALGDGRQFTEMTNSEFDVLFGATDRDHEVQFRVLFSPMAQINMVDLLRSPVGYGDDFNFIKKGRFNCIESEHAQRWGMDASPANYYSYDVDIAKQKFVDFNNEYFKSVYFDFAPLLTIPAYHQEPSEVFEPIKRETANYTYYEHEALANAVGARYFAHQASVTEVILKSRYLFSRNDIDVVEVTANSYAAENRVDFVPVLGGDGRIHSVPVPWVEYIPVSNRTNVAVKKLGYLNKDFKEKVKVTGVGDALFNTPSAYFHGLFAKIIDGNDVSPINSILDRLK